MPKDDETVISIRFPNPLAAALKGLAKDEHRSVNGTVLEAVERYLRTRRGRPSRGGREGQGGQIGPAEDEG
jgi:hypothetical protein